MGRVDDCSQTFASHRRIEDALDSLSDGHPACLHGEIIGLRIEEQLRQRCPRQPRQRAGEVERVVPQYNVGRPGFGGLVKASQVIPVFGQRSGKAAEHFRGLGFTEVYNVAGGIDAWAQDVDTTIPRY